MSLTVAVSSSITVDSALVTRSKIRDIPMAPRMTYLLGSLSGLAPERSE